MRAYPIVVGQKAFILLRLQRKDWSEVGETVDLWSTSHSFVHCSIPSMPSSLHPTIKLSTHPLIRICQNRHNDFPEPSIHGSVHPAVIYGLLGLSGWALWFLWSFWALVFLASALVFPGSLVSLVSLVYLVFLGSGLSGLWSCFVFLVFLYLVCFYIHDDCYIVCILPTVYQLLRQIHVSWALERVIGLPGLLIMFYGQDRFMFCKRAYTLCIRTRTRQTTIITQSSVIKTQKLWYELWDIWLMSCNETRLRPHQ